MTDHRFGVGVHRPVYLWAGPGTVRMNRLKFMGARVDEPAHADAHTEIGAQRLAEEAGFNWAYLTYNWGFPPETEQQDWEDFGRAVSTYHDAGIQVFGYVQTSNCVYSGSFRDRDWYALDPRGRRFHYYTGRFMTCWSHPDWQDHLRSIVRGIVESGADGVFFDNPWHGAQPLHVGGTWLGPAGCHCPRCQQDFRLATGLRMPSELTPESQECRTYLLWRAAQVTSILARLAGHARALNPDIVISANDFDAVMRPSTLTYGIDLPALAQVQDVVMIEDYGLPRWHAGDGPRSQRSTLVNNALTLRTARALIGRTFLSTNPYDKGIGFDGVYSSRRFRQAIAEAAACGAAMVVKGTEYVEDGCFTLLTAQQFAPQRQAIGAIQRWLSDHAGLFVERRPAAQVALLHPGDALWARWNRLAPLYFGVGQTLLAAGIPWRTVTDTSDWSDLSVLFCLESSLPDRAVPRGLRVIPVLGLDNWEPPPPPLLQRHQELKGLASWALGRLFQAYFRRRWVRGLVDRLGLVHFFWQTPFFRLPSPGARATLMAALGEIPHPRIAAQAPVLAELWRRGLRWQLHLVNYDAVPQQVTVDFGQRVAGRVLTPDPELVGKGLQATGPDSLPGRKDGEATARDSERYTEEFRASTLHLMIDVYSLLEYERESVA